MKSDKIRRLANGSPVTPILQRPKNEQPFLKQFNLYNLKSKKPEEILSQVNPNYLSGKCEWTHNCQKCIVAWEMLHRGYNVTAKPFNPNDSIGNSAIAAWKFDSKIWWQDRNVRYSFSKFEMKKALAEAFEEWGENTRVMIRIKRIDGSAHAFTARMTSGKILYEDPQSA